MAQLSARKFFSEVVYSAANEDSESELAALRLDPSSRVLCLTGSGARALDLLVGAPAQIVSIDFNPAQSALLELKIAAMRVLERRDYLGFAGATAAWQGERRRRFYLDQLASVLSAPARSFWDARPGAIADGILYCGRWEKYLRAMALAGAWRRPLVRKLLNCSTIAEQSAVWRHDWDGLLWRLMLKGIGKRALWRYVLREPGIAFVPPEFNISEYLHACFQRSADSILLRKAAFFALMFVGRYAEDGPFPLHMQAEHYIAVRSRLDLVDVVTAPLHEYLLKPECRQRFDAFSLSDFSSYCSEAEYDDVWRHVGIAAAPGARVCERQFLVKRQPLRERLVRRDLRLEAQLEQQDTSIIYSFVCGELVSSAEGC